MGVSDGAANGATVAVGVSSGTAVAVALGCAATVAVGCGSGTTIAIALGFCGAGVEVAGIAGVRVGVAVASGPLHPTTAITANAGKTAARIPFIPEGTLIAVRLRNM